MLEDLGPGVALKALADEVGARDGMLITFTRRNGACASSQRHWHGTRPDCAEALPNVSKHAGKAYVKVSPEVVAEGFRLTVRDSGEDFDPSNTGARAGFGRIRMQERARLINRSISLESELGERRAVAVTAPLPAEKEVENV